MIQNLKLYFYCSRLIIRGSMLHRFSFFAGIIGQWLGYGATYFSLYVMVSQFGTLENWTAAEVLFMYAFNMLSYSLAASVFF